MLWLTLNDVNFVSRETQPETALAYSLLDKRLTNTPTYRLKGSKTVISPELVVMNSQIVYGMKYQENFTNAFDWTLMVLQSSS